MKVSSHKEVVVNLECHIDTDACNGIRQAKCPELGHLQCSVSDSLAPKFIHLYPRVLGFPSVSVETMSWKKKTKKKPKANVPVIIHFGQAVLFNCSYDRNS